MTTTLTTSEIFRFYNKARWVSGWDKGRSNRALGLLLQKDQSWRKKYHPTTRSCGCPDHAKTNLVCKHMRAIMIETRIIQNRPTTAPAPVVNTNPGLFYNLGDGSIYVIEQLSYGFRNHYFDSIEEAKLWIATPGHGAIVQRGTNHGKRLRPDHDHRFGGRN